MSFSTRFTLGVQLFDHLYCTRRSVREGVSRVQLQNRQKEFLRKLRVCSVPPVRTTCARNGNDRGAADMNFTALFIDKFSNTAECQIPANSNPFVKRMLFEYNPVING